jgi:hypothetical protein
MPTHFESLTQRIEHLEHENRQLKRFGVAVLILIGAVLAMGQARPARTIEAERFLLKDVDGNVKAKLDVKDGSGELSFYDHAGHQRIELTSTESYSALNLKDDAEGLGATMEVGTSKDGTPSTIAALGSMSGPGIIMQATKDSTSLRVSDKGGHQIWAAPSQH